MFQERLFHDSVPNSFRVLWTSSICSSVALCALTMFFVSFASLRWRWRIVICCKALIRRMGVWLCSAFHKGLTLCCSFFSLGAAGPSSGLLMVSGSHFLFPSWFVDLIVHGKRTFLSFRFSVWMLVLFSIAAWYSIWEKSLLGLRYLSRRR